MRAVIPEDRPGDYQDRVREGYLRAAGTTAAGVCSYYPAAIVVIDATADPDAVFDQIRNEVERALALGPRT